MTNYENGANFERRVKRMYEAKGYFCVRSAGSHGPADLVCIKEETEKEATARGGYIRIPDVVLIQMKIPKGWKDRKETLKKIAEEKQVRAVYIWREDKPPYKIHEEDLSGEEDWPNPFSD